jgi:uncharacterized protein YhfF
MASARFFVPIRIGSTPAQADEGAALILSGVKTATSSRVGDFPDGVLPFAGALSVLLDGRDQPVGIVETLQVQTVRFDDVTEAMAQAYGEGERTLAWWRRVMGDWYRRQSAEQGLVFDGDSLLIWETIAVTRRLA